MPQPKFIFLRYVPGEGTYYRTQDIYPGGGPHEVLVTDESLADRKTIYNINGNDDAVITHLMWEVYISLNPDSPDSDLPDDIKANFDKAWGPGHKAARGKPMTQSEIALQHLRFQQLRGRNNGSRGTRRS